MSYVLGLDLGTSSLKGILVARNGDVIATVSSDYPLSHPKPGYSEQNPADWLAACDQVINKLGQLVPDFSAGLEGISFSGQMHSLIVLDADDQVIRPAILWNDVRTTAQCAQIMAEFGEELLATTKNIALEGFTLPKIIWLQQNEPENWQKVAKLFLPKDYLRYWLTDQYHMDYSDAAGTLLLDLNTSTWSEAIMKQFDIPHHIMPELIESIGYVGDVTPALKAKYGFQQDVRVFAGGADNACAAVGAGIVDDSLGMASIGTSGVFLSAERDQSPEYAGQLHLFNHAAPHLYYSMGVTLAAGNSLNWFKQTFAADRSYDELLKDIAGLAPGASGLIFTPYINGERTPHIDSQIRGSFIGVDATHTLTHFAKAVIEGITFSLKDSQTLMEQVAAKQFRKIVSVGGGAKNPQWQQIQADIFDAEITTLAAEEGPGFGAAMLAAVGVNWYASLKECAQQFVQYTETVTPNPAHVKQYAELYDIYREVYGATKAISHKLGQFK